MGTMADAAPMLIVFGRWPVAERVKTRLAASIGAPAALAVYRSMLLTTLASGRACSHARRRCLDVDGTGADPALLASIRAGAWELRLQAEGDLGARMKASLASSEVGVPSVLVGTDGAFLDTRYLDAAFEALARHDAVIGPTEDGGYLLLGARRPLPDAVFAQRWSTSQVCAATCAAIEQAGLSLARLSPVLDIDEIGDLVRAPALVAIATAAGMASRSETGSAPGTCLKPDSSSGGDRSRRVR